jgi:F420-dependent oxidoreductase-like protein
MLDVAIMIEGQDGLNWSRWKKLASAAEDLGFAGLYRSDHFTNPQGPHKDAIEVYTSLTYLAAETKRIEFGPMVSPVSFRDPIVTTWAAAAIDDLSGGRLRLGLGAGWQEREHNSFGYKLLDVDARFRRLREALTVTSLLLKSDTPSAFDGNFYHLEDALLLPRPARAGGPPIVIGGNGPLRTLPLVAEFADEWNSVGATPTRFAELTGKLDQLLIKRGRKPESVKRTLMTRTVIGKTQEEVLAKLNGADPDALRERGTIVGEPAAIVEQLGKLAEAGVSRVMAQWLDMDDLDGLELLSAQVLPQLA